jgi:hypothetical protein
MEDISHGGLDRLERQCDIFLLELSIDIVLNSSSFSPSFVILSRSYA